VGAGVVPAENRKGNLQNRDDRWKQAGGVSSKLLRVTPDADGKGSGGGLDIKKNKLIASENYAVQKKTEKAIRLVSAD